VADSIEKLVVRDIAGVLGMRPEAVDVNKPLPELGFDSLMAVELSVALEHSTGHGFNRMSLLRPDLTAAELISVIETEAPKGAKANGSTMPSKASPPPVAIPGVNVEELSDAQVDTLLRELSAGE
jgi:acyl carrier protein